MPVNLTQSADSIDKYGNPKDWKRQKLEGLREYHRRLIEDLEISPQDFNMKMPFYDSRGRMVVGVFPSEFKKEKGFFFEIVTRELEPVDSNRTVYRVPPSNHFEEEYEQNEKGSFLVPMEELRVVNPQSVAISKSSAVTSNDRFFQTGELPLPKAGGGTTTVMKTPSEDAPYAEMTIRDFMAIHTGKPVSQKSWLNDLIQTTQK
jgi:hypothetical protein